MSTEDTKIDPTEFHANLRRGLERGLKSAQLRKDSEAVDTFTHCLDNYQSMLTATDINKETILQEAQRLVHGERCQDYGHPFYNFSQTALLVNGLLAGRFKDGMELIVQDIPLIMVCVKLARQCNKAKRDNLVDGAGYFETAAMVEDYIKQLKIVSRQP